MELGALDYTEKEDGTVVLARQKLLEVTHASALPPLPYALCTVVMSSSAVLLLCLLASTHGIHEQRIRCCRTASSSSLTCL